MRLGVSLAVTQPRGGDPVAAALAGFKHVYDARRGSAFTDYGTGAANGTPTDVTHSGKWWAFNGTSSRVDLFDVPSITLGASDDATFVVVARRASASNPVATLALWNYKTTATGATPGSRMQVTTGGLVNSLLADGTNSSTKTASAITMTSNTLHVVVARAGASTHRLTVNGTDMGTTDRGTVGNATPNTIPKARVGQVADSLPGSGWFDGEVGLVAATQRQLSDAEVSALTTAIQGAWA